MVFDSEALQIRPTTWFHGLKPTSPFELSVSLHRTPERPRATLHGAGLGSRPGSFEQPKPFPRQRTLDHGTSLVCYEFARTTLLGRWNCKKSTQCNCCTIGPIRQPRTAQKAGTSGRHGAYFVHIAARRPISRPRFGKSPRPHCRPPTTRPVHSWPTSGERRG